MKTALPEVITSTEELDQALAVLGDLNAQEQCITAELDQKLAAVRDQYSAAYTVELMSGPVPMAEVKENLVNAIERYCDDHRSELLTGDKKSVELVHGVIGWRKKPDRVVELELTEEEEAKGILQYCRTLALKALEGAKKIFKCALLDVVRVKTEWNKSEILKRVNDRAITPAQLTKAGLSIERGDDHFYCEPKSEKRV